MMITNIIILGRNHMIRYQKILRKGIRTIQEKECRRQSKSIPRLEVNNMIANATLKINLNSNCRNRKKTLHSTNNPQVPLVQPLSPLRKPISHTHHILLLYNHHQQQFQCKKKNLQKPKISLCQIKVLPLIPTQQLQVELRVWNVKSYKRLLRTLTKSNVCLQKMA